MPTQANKKHEIINWLHENGDIVDDSINTCTHVTAENWANVVERTKRVIMSDWNHDIAFHNLCTQELFINITEDSSSNESNINDDSDDSC
ncbi:unnamed protein product [Euphydryas editha]|uniref:Uncharacterized protein n=1 Tax=Euphydryas editha TaxID=104508 RepID=A0AAU9V7U2_EUPED|nr:unnamed protein product [Euphydryas editha]